MRPVSSRSHHWALGLGLLVLVSALTPTFRASAAPSLSSFRVASPNPEQQADIETLRQELAKRGLPQDGIGVFALLTSDGPTTIVTRFPDEFRLSDVAPGVYDLTRIEAAYVGGRLPGLIRAAATGPGWVRNNADCDVYSTKGFARTQCFEINAQAQDSDGATDFWQYTVEASGHSKVPRRMDRMWVERKPLEGSPRQNFDGIPEPKEPHNRIDACRQEADSISVTSGQPLQAGWSHTWTRTTCETYRPKMYDDEGHWATIWEGHPDVGEKEMRHVMFTMPVKTAQGQGPAWVRLNGQHTTR
jgi:hypothetical protein